MVLGVKQYKEKNTKKKDKWKEDDGYQGYINVKISIEDMKKIYAIEKAGEMLLIPAQGNNNDEIIMQDILPQLRTFRELRGLKYSALSP